MTQWSEAIFSTLKANIFLTSNLYYDPVWPKYWQLGIVWWDLQNLIGLSVLISSNLDSWDFQWAKNGKEKNLNSAIKER